MPFDQLPLAVRVQLAGLGPMLVGLVCGFCLHVSAGAYWAVSAAGIVGGVGGGLDSADRSAALRRGVLGGALFGLGLVVAHTMAKGEAYAPLPRPAILVVPFSALAGTALAWLGGRARG